MNDSSPSFVTRELQWGFLAPLDCLKFFGRHKFLLVSALAPHIATLSLSIWAVLHFAVAPLTREVEALATALPPALVQGVIGTALVLSCFILYTLLGVSLLNALLSPLFDVIAAKAFAHASGRELPQLGALDFFRSFLSECSKTILVFTALAMGVFLPMAIPGGFLLSFVVAPSLLVVSIWFFGWDHMDRTLALMGLPLRRRLLFGVRHFLACMALGIWMYVPFAGTFLSFTLAAAGAMVVARLHPVQEKRTE